MPERNPLSELIQSTPDRAAPKILIYSQQLNPRLDYVCGFIFNTVLRLSYDLTTDLSLFRNSQSFRINYSKEEVSGVAQITPHRFLSEKGIETNNPASDIRNGQLYFFTNADGGFDVFSAVFYLISRYEEWKDFKKDQHGRFEAQASCLYPDGFHLQPVADQWIMELKEQLAAAYPTLVFPPLRFKVVSTLDVDNLYAYRNKGAARTIGASIKDLLRGDFKNFNERLKVLRGKIPDPFDVYNDISLFCKEHNVPLFCFFLFRSGTPFDRTVDPSSGAFEPVLETLKSNGAFVGLHPSYYTSEQATRMADEISEFSKRSNRKTILSRQHYLRFNIRSTPAWLLQNGIAADFTMGFASSPGFRAGTAYPFRWYNFESEQAAELVFVPFCAMDGAYFIYKKTTPEEAMKSLLNLSATIKKTGGNFITVFHERTFSNHLYPGFATLYKNLQVALKGSGK